MNFRYSFLFILFPLKVAAATVASSSLWWNSLGENYDYVGDQQTGSPSGDIVGVGKNHGFFTVFNIGKPPTMGELGFRVRLDAAGGPANSPTFNRVFWVGVDANNDNALDVFFGVNFQGSANELVIRVPGAGKNVSPDTISISSTSAFTYVPTDSNYNYRLVDYLADGGTLNDLTTDTAGDPDYYLSFMLPFQDIVAVLATRGISVDDSSLFRYVMATSTQTHNINQDLGGIEGAVDSPLSWDQLGVFTPLVLPTGAQIPEHGSAFLGAVGIILLLLHRHRVV